MSRLRPWSRARSRSGPTCCARSPTSPCSGSAGRASGAGSRSRSSTAPFPLELFDGPHSRRGTDSEAAALGSVEPAAALRLWGAADDRYPHTVLLAAEAVHATAEQGPAAAEELDLALRAAFWTHSRSISHRQVILDVAGELRDLDVATLADALDTGRHRAAVMRDFAVARAGAIPGSPTFRLADGTALTNPGMSVHWEGDFGSGFPVVDSDDPAVYDELLRAAVSGTG